MNVLEAPVSTKAGVDKSPSRSNTSSVRPTDASLIGVARLSGLAEKGSSAPRLRIGLLYSASGILQRNGASCCDSRLSPAQLDTFLRHAHLPKRGTGVFRHAESVR